jgi:hypothetical protein
VKFKVGDKSDRPKGRGHDKNGNGPGKEMDELLEPTMDGLIGERQDR